MHMNDQQKAAAIFAKYNRHYDGEVQGCCPLIADEIQREVGGEVVAGYLTFFGGSQRRTHWWVEKDGATLDPMGDEFMKHPEDYAAREVAHRDRGIFDRILPQYEQWRVADFAPRAGSQRAIAECEHAFVDGPGDFGGTGDGRPCANGCGAVDQY